MNKFESLFAEYPCGLTQESVQAAVADILAQHFDENNHVEVWKQCFNMIDLTSLNSTDTEDKIGGMMERVNEFKEKYPEMPKLLVCKSQQMFNSSLEMPYVDIISVDTHLASFTSICGLTACLEHTNGPQIFIYSDFCHANKT